MANDTGKPTGTDVMTDKHMTGLTIQPTDDLADMPIAVKVYFDDRLYTRIEAMSQHMAKSEIMMPAHLRGKPDACFAVIIYALTWKLNPYAVAGATYQVSAGAKVGFEGKLVQAIIENSGRLEPGSGGVRYEYYGDWSQVEGKFAIRESSKKNDDGEGRKYAVPTWTDDDARKGGCGVRVMAHMRGEPIPRELNFDLIQAQPRNSTLWATSPRRQICYTAVRAFGNTACPGLLMGVPFDADDNAAPPAERDMGAADVVAVEQPTERKTAATSAAAPSKPEAPAMPSSSASAGPKAGPAADAPAASGPSTIDHETGEVQHAELASTEQRRMIAIKMQHAALQDGDLIKKFGFSQHQIPKDKVNAVLAFCDNPMG